MAHRTLGGGLTDSVGDDARCGAEHNSGAVQAEPAHRPRDRVSGKPDPARCGVVRQQRRPVVSVQRALQGDGERRRCGVGALHLECVEAVDDPRGRDRLANAGSGERLGEVDPVVVLLGLAWPRLRRRGRGNRRGRANRRGVADRRRHRSRRRDRRGDGSGRRRGGARARRRRRRRGGGGRRALRRGRRNRQRRRRREAGAWRDRRRRRRGGRRRRARRR